MLTVDHFTEHTPRQPKLEIGNHMEGKGLLVPRRFKSIKEALNSGEPFIVRSEHPSERAFRFRGRPIGGISGLLESRRIDPNDSADPLLEAALKVAHDEEALKRLFLMPSENNIVTFCNIAGIDPECFKADASFSYWQFIRGNRHTMIRDSALPDVYHLTVHQDSLGNKLSGHSIVENGAISNAQFVGERILGEPLAPAILQELIEVYNRVRTLGSFNREDCPLMELVRTEDGGVFVLQTKTTQHFAPATFTLPPSDPSPGTKEALFVRGATPPEGIQGEATVWVRADHRSRPCEQGAARAFMPISLNIDRSWMELNLPDAPVAIDHIASPSFGALLGRIGTGHINKTFLFRGGCAAIMVGGNGNYHGLGRDFWGKAQTHSAVVPIRYTSDGRRGRLEVLGNARVVE